MKKCELRFIDKRHHTATSIDETNYFVEIIATGMKLWCHPTSNGEFIPIESGDFSWCKKKD